MKYFMGFMGLALCATIVGCADSDVYVEASAPAHEDDPQIVCVAVKKLPGKFLMLLCNGQEVYVSLAGVK